MKELGALRIRKRLAGDATTDFWLAYDRDIDRDCLVRILRPDPGADEEHIEQGRRAFLSEARALAAIDHPAVARIFDIGMTPNGDLYAVLPPYPRRLTERLAETTSVEQAEAGTLLIGVLGGLAAAHDVGVWHGALGPESIFLRPHAPHVKLIGFGGRGDETERRASWSATVAADVFQIGLLAYRLYAGATATARSRRPREASPSVPLSIDTWIVDCLRRDPSERPASAQAALDRLRAALAAGDQPEKAYA